MTINFTSPPAWLAAAVPDATTRVDAVKAARRAHADAAVALRAAGEAATAATTGRFTDGEVRPAPGISGTHARKAVDAYHAATDTSDAARRHLARTRSALEAHMQAGIRTEAFREEWGQRAEAARTRAQELLAELRETISTRDELDKLTGRELQLPKSWHGLTYALDEVSAYVDAPVIDDAARAARLLEGRVFTSAADKAAFLREAGIVLGADKAGANA